LIFLITLIGNPIPLVSDYEVVGEFGIVKTVYMPIEKIQDQDCIGHALGKIVDPSETMIQVDFFDDRSSTPGRYPMTDSELAHWRAHYNFNRQTGYEGFIYITNGNLLYPNLREVPVRPIRD